VAVFMKDTALTADLAQLVRQADKPVLAHAAYIALDRLVDASAADVLGQLQAHREWMSGREATRADYFARADVREPSQRLVLEHYLLDPPVRPPNCSNSPEYFQTRTTACPTTC